jgi:peptidoglycan/LPS O-acetylase OafA/YrhL
VETTQAASERGLLERIGDRLSRVTSHGGFIPEIDGLRFVAIAAVVLHHICSIYLESSGRFGGDVRFPRDWRRLSNESVLVHALWQGYFGVHLFFVLSGFVLGLPFVRHYLGGESKPSIRNYFVRRLTRIEPPYVLNLIVCLALFAINTPPIYRDTIEHFLASLFYVHNAVYSKGSMLNGVAWSLEIEVQFYILAPLLAMLFLSARSVWLRRGILVAAIYGCALFTQKVLWMTQNEALKMSLAAYLQYFLAGFLLADLHQSGALKRSNWGWDLIGLGGAVMTLLTMMLWRGPLYCALPFLVLAFYCGAFRGPLLQRIFTTRAIVIIGGMCYTIYLYHVVVISVFKSLMLGIARPEAPLWLDLGTQVAVFVPLILLICSVLFVYTEKPFMGKPFWKRSLNAVSARRQSLSNPPG